MAFQLSLGARVRKSPFFDKTVAAGVTHFTTYNHMMMPTSFGDPMAEYWRLIEGVSMWDVAVERQVAVKGPDALMLADYLTPRDLSTLTIGQGRYVPICDHRGVIHNDPVVLRVDEDEVWFSIADSDMLLWARAISAERAFDATVWEPDVSPLAIQGPKAASVAANLFGDWVNELKHFAFRDADLQGIPVVVAKSGWSKQGGFELYLKDGARAGELWDLVAEAGKPYDIGPGSPNGIERVESGLISIGTDTDDSTNPFELGMGRFINVAKTADYVGSSALRQLADVDPLRAFRGFFIEGEKLVGGSQHKWRLMDANGADVGFISAAVWSPRLERNIGLGLVYRDAIDGPLQTISESGIRDVSVSTLPFDMNG